MSKQHSNTAILLFSRSVEAEAREKKLAFDNRKAAHIASLMIENTRQIVQSTGIPYYFFTEEQQVGSTFGERLTHAFETIFSKGYENVICIGNDCLTISKKDILKAAQALSTDTDTVFGEAFDGGAYFIGFKKTAFDAQSFKDIAWHTPSVFDALLTISTDKKLRTVCLEKKKDIDSFEELIKILNTLPIRLKKAFLHIISFFSSIIFKEIQTISLGFIPIAGLLRAPPL